MSEYSIYPKAIDGYAQIPLAVDKKSPINAESVNRLRSGIINIEKAIGIAPFFSSEYGTFPDLCGRIENIELITSGISNEIKSEVISSFSEVKIEDLVEELTLTSIYIKEPFINLGSKPLTFDGKHPIAFAYEGQEDAHIVNGSDFLIESRKNLALKARGITEGSINPEVPNCVVIEDSDPAVIMYDPESGYGQSITGYLSFGGEFERSDLSIFRTEATSNSAFLAMSMHISTGLSSEGTQHKIPVNLAITTLSHTNPEAHGADISIRAAQSLFNEKSPGGVTIETGANPIYSESAIRLLGGRRGGGGGLIELTAGSCTEPMSSNGASLVLDAASEEHGGGAVYLRAGTSKDGEDLAPLTIRAGSARSRLEDGTLPQGSIRMIGNTEFSGRISKPFKTFDSSSTYEPNAPIYNVTENDSTILVESKVVGTWIVLPPPITASGVIYTIKWYSGAVPFGIRSESAGYGDMEEGKYITMINPGCAVTVQSDGSRWLIISSHNVEHPGLYVLMGDGGFVLEVPDGFVGGGGTLVGGGLSGSVDLDLDITAILP